MHIERTQRRIRLRDLEALVAVVDAGAMRKASSQLHLSQPAVSKAIKALEGVLEIPLLDRGRRGVEPTVFGAALVRRSKGLIDELQGALRELAYLADPASGEVRLGAVETLQAGLVSEAIRIQLQRTPRMRLFLEQAQSPELISQVLRERQIDFVLARPFSLPLPQDVAGEPLYRDKLRVVVGKGHPLARRRHVSLADLHDAFWILSKNETRPGSPVSQAFADLGLELPEKTVVGASLHMRQQLLATRRYVTCMPHSYLHFQPQREAIKVLPVDLPLWSSPIMVLTLRGRALAPAAEVFLRTLRELAMPLVTDEERQQTAGAPGGHMHTGAHERAA